MHYLSDEELRRVEPAEQAGVRSPIPTQVVSNGEFTPLPQSEDQRRLRVARGQHLMDALG